MLPIFNISISGNIKCAVKDGFCKFSHIYTYVSFNNIVATE